MFLLNLQSKEPIYEQIQTQILHFIDAGILSPGSKLPSVRQLAMENGINPNTVAKAYSEMEKNGYVYNLPKKGVYVAELDKDHSRIEQAEHMIRSLKDGGFSKEEVLKCIEEVYREGAHVKDHESE